MHNRVFINPRRGMNTLSADVRHGYEMIRHFAIWLIVIALHVPQLDAEHMEILSPDLATPSVIDGTPAPGTRVRQFNQEFTGSKVYHVLYLPTDWVKGKKFPVIVEYAGNKWKTSLGTVEGSNLGYGISGGKGVIWVCMPFVDNKNQMNATTWWGDIETTVQYCKKTVNRICTEYGGDASNVFLAGFSRGAIACNFIGLHDDEIASLWRGFICHSHYDGVKEWGYAGSDRKSAATRLTRLGNRPQFISQEGSVDEAKSYLKMALPSGNFTFQAMSFPDHTDTWVLRDIPERKVIRDWFNKALRNHGQPGVEGDAANRAP